MYSLVWTKDNNDNFINLIDDDRVSEPIKTIVERAARKKRKIVNLEQFGPFAKEFRSGLWYADFAPELDLGEVDGNRLVKTKADQQRINAGDKLGQAKSFASVADRSETAYCLSCKIQHANYNECETCHLALFCSKQCEDRNNTHQYECGTNFHCIQFGDDLDVKLAMQMVFKSLAIYGNADKLTEAVKALLVGERIDQRVPNGIDESEERFQCIMKLYTSSLDGSYELKVHGAYRTIMQYPKIQEGFNSKNYCNFLKHLLAHFMKIIHANSFRVKQEKLDIEMIFDTMSFLNHSCSPNALNFFIRDTMVLISSRPIKSETEIRICYDAKFFSTDMNTDMRQDYLKEKWGFKCDCERCKNDVEITKADLTSVLQSKKTELMESEINKNVTPKAKWTPKIGAYCIAYYKACLNSLNKKSV